MEHLELTEPELGGASTTPISTALPIFTGPRVETRKPVHPYRTTARIVGALYLAGMVVGIGGNIVIQTVLTRRTACRRSRPAACCWPSGR